MLWKSVVFASALSVLTAMWGSVYAIDLSYSDITVVNDSTRFQVKFPGIVLEAFDRVQNIKGNFVFTMGERISGDRLLVTFLDSTQFTKSEDVEVQLTYPAKGYGGSTITSIEIYTVVSSDDADAFLIDGGIRQSFAQVLLAANKTLYYTYEMYMYGY